jgi:type VI protein secretion system component Hcp
MEYKMTGVIITSFRSGSHGYGETLPLEEVSLSYATIEWKYTKLDETSGDPVGTAVKKWDLKGNK